MPVNAPPPPSSLEGRMLAHRQLLVLLVQALPARQQQMILDHLGARSVFQDGQEDPGAVPGEALALGYALADENRMLARLLREAREARSSS